MRNIEDVLDMSSAGACRAEYLVIGKLIKGAGTSLTCRSPTALIATINGRLSTLSPCLVLQRRFKT